MAKKLLLILFSLFFLVACGQKDESVKIDFKGPSSPPDPETMMPTYGPNDPAPVIDSGSN